MKKCKCDTCIYRAVKNMPWKCEYICITGHSRPCDVDNCIVYKKGNKLYIDKLINNIWKKDNY